MNKDEFNKLEIEQQVEYIHKGLEVESLTKVCASIGIGRSTVSKRFKNKGYELIDNKYIKTTINTKKTNMDDPEIQEITDNLKKLINNNRYDIMLYIRPYKNLEKEKLSKALEILINQIDNIQLNDKYNRMLEINKAILWLNSSVNIELVLAKIAKALGR